MLNQSLQAFGDFITATSPALNWLGYGARPYKNAEGAPGTYYVPSKHPYQATLTDGIQVQEAYPGQYYLLRPTSGFGALPKLPYSRWLCALIGALAGGGAGYGGAYYYGRDKPWPSDKKRKLPAQVAVGTAVAGAIAGYFMCGQTQVTQPTPVPPGPAQPPMRLIPRPAPAPDIR